MTDLRSIIPALITQRNLAGSSTPIGRRLSTAIEQIEIGLCPLQTIAEIEQIRLDGGQYVHEHHGHSKGAM